MQYIFYKTMPMKLIESKNDIKLIGEIQYVYPQKYNQTNEPPEARIHSYIADLLQ